MVSDSTKPLSLSELADYPYRELLFVRPELQIKKHEDGSILLESPIALKPLEKSIPHLFKRQAQRFPNRVWLAEKSPSGGWSELSYQEFDQRSDSIAQWMLDRGFNQATPLMVLSENSLAHGLMIMGAMKAQVPVASISAPYSLMDASLSKLKMVTAKLQPTLVFAQCAERYANALSELDEGQRTLIVANKAHDDLIDFDSILTTPVVSVEQSIEQITHDTIAKTMFTSGSTGTPKCVVQTQGVLCSQVAGIESISVNNDPENYSPISLQWMPWSHVSAGNISYHEAILKGGAIYIDDGKPIPGLFDKTIDNLRGLSTSVFGSAPLGLSWLATALENDSGLQAVFFKKLEAIAYGGSALPEDIATRIQRLAVANTGKRVPLISMYGSTETQGVTATYWATEIPGVIGLPMPGMQIKLVPVASKLEVRVKGGTVMREYLGDKQLTEDSFDEQGFFKLGDAARFADASDPLQGLVFDGRISEDFKLLSGTWVSTVNVKSKLLKSAGKLLRDVVVCGENQLFVSALAWLDKLAAQALVGELAIGELIQHPALQEALQASLDDYNEQSQGSSMKVKTLVLLTEDASMAASEVNEKGYVNTKVVARNRQSVLDAVYASDDGLGVIGEQALMEVIAT